MSDQLLAENLLYLAEHIPEVIWITDPELRTLWYVSPAYERIWGRSCASLYEAPDSWTAAIHPDDRERVLRGIAEVPRTGEFEEKYRVVRPDGTVRWVADRGTMTAGTGNAPRRFVGIADDITEQVRTEGELREAKAMAEAADHAKSAFLAAMSHELRTPLTAIIGFSELLEDGTGGPLTDRQHKYATNILTSGRALLGLVDQVLDISRVEVGRLGLSLAPIDVAEMLDDVAMLVRPLAAKRRVTLEVSLSPGIPRITADAPKVKQVVFGLLADAVRTSPEGGTVRLVAGARDDVAGSPGQWIEIAVADSGARLSPERRERLLHDFSAGGEGARATRAEAGMSVALARKLIELHGGLLWLEDAAPGTGNVVRVLLPQVARAIGSRNSPSAPMHAIDESSDAPLVLVVEDDPAASDLLAHYIEEGGYRVARAYTCAEGLAMARKLVPFAITIDSGLPDGDGLDLLASVRRTPELADVPALVVSVSTPRDDVVRLGATAWIMKPVNRTELLGVLRRQPGAGATPGHRGASR